MPTSYLYDTNLNKPDPIYIKNEDVVPPPSFVTQGDLLSDASKMLTAPIKNTSVYATNPGSNITSKTNIAPTMQTTPLKVSVVKKPSDLVKQKVIENKVEKEAAKQGVSITPEQKKAVAEKASSGEIDFSGIGDFLRSLAAGMADVNTGYKAEFQDKVNADIRARRQSEADSDASTPESKNAQAIATEMTRGKYDFSNSSASQIYRSFPMIKELVDERITREKIWDSANGGQGQPGGIDKSKYIEGYNPINNDYEYVTPNAAKEAKQLSGDTQSSIELVNQLESLLKKPNPLNIEYRNKVSNLRKALVGKMRIPIMGPGVMDKNERKILESMIPSENDIMKGWNQAKFDSLKTAISSGTNKQMEAYGYRKDGSLFSSGQSNAGKIYRVNVEGKILKVPYEKLGELAQRYPNADVLDD